MSKRPSSSLLSLDFERLHHAYLLIGGSRAAENAVLDFFQGKGVKLTGSPDYFVFREALLGIDDARKLSEQAIRRAFGVRKVFFLAPEKITLEAQNALLKTFEEPIRETHFFLALRAENLVLSTLRSRTETIFLEEEEEEMVEAEKFLKLSIKERLNFVKKFVDAEKNLSVFLDEILLVLRGRGTTAPALQSVYKLRLVSDDRGVSSRLILEHLATVL